MYASPVVEMYTLNMCYSDPVLFTFRLFMIWESFDICVKAKERVIYPANINCPMTGANATYHYEQNALELYYRCYVLSNVHAFSIS